MKVSVELTYKKNVVIDMSEEEIECYDWQNDAMLLAMESDTEYQFYEGKISNLETDEEYTARIARQKEELARLDKQVEELPF